MNVEKNKKLIGLIAGILVLIVLCFILKYIVLIPLAILLIIAVTFLVNRKILRLRKKAGESTEKQYSLSDAEVEKFSGYFVNQEEKYLSSLGNGYIMNYFANGSLSRGFAVISDKRVYFRGSCFTGSGKTLKKSDEERTVDIKDVTGSGFIYQRYLGVLIGLFAALAVLILGIAGSAVQSRFRFGDFSRSQSREEYNKEQLDNVKEIIKQSESLEADIADAAQDLEDLQTKLDELRAKQSVEITQYLVDNMDWGDLEYMVYGSELDRAYQQYLDRLFDIVRKETPLSSWLARLNKIAYKYGDASSDDSFRQWTWMIQVVTDTLLNNVYYEEDGDLYDVMNSLELVNCVDNYNYEAERLLASGEINTASECLQITGLSGSAKLSAEEGVQYLGAPDYILWLAYQCQWLDWYNNENNSSVSELYYLYYMDPYGNICDINDLNSRWHYGDHMAEFYDPVRDAFDAAFEEFLEETGLSGLGEDASLEEMVVCYQINHPDSSFGQYFTDMTSVETSYDGEIEEVNAQINQKKQDINDLKQRQEGTLIAEASLEGYEREYQAVKRDTFKSFTSAIGSCSLAALLLTFAISCLLVLLDYLKKRKTFFEIQYAGGRIAFDVSFYAKAEIDDFQKQLRRAKDLVSERMQTVERAATVSPAAETAQTQSVPDDLRKYAELLKEGLITQEEYDAMKKKILKL